MSLPRSLEQCMLVHLTTHYFCDAALMPGRPTIVHVGGDARTAARLLSRWPGARIVIVEGDRVNYAALTAQPLPPRVEAVHAALAQEDGPVTMHRVANPGANSLWPMHRRGRWPLVAAEDVPGKTLGALMADTAVASLDLLLMNCEGAEIYAAWQLALDPRLRRRVAQVCTATHWRHYPVYPKRHIDVALDALAAYYVCVRECRDGLEYVLLRRREPL